MSEGRDEDRDSRGNKEDLKWKDYLAMIIAMFETTLTPFLIFIALLLVIITFLTIR